MKQLIEFKKNAKGWRVNTPDGWEEFQGIAKYELLEIVELTTRNGITFECSTCHSLIDKDGESLQAKKSLNRLIKTDKGLDKVIQIKYSKEKKHVYDMVGVPSKVFYCSKGILHHNTHLLEDFWSSVIPTISSGKKSKILMVSCVTKDTFIHTSKGIQQIKDLIDDSKLGPYYVSPYQILGKDYTRSGNIVVNNGKQQTLQIKTPHSFLECSHEHKLWACKQGKFGWFKSSELAVGDFIAMQSGMNLWGNNDNTEDFEVKALKNKNVWLPKKITPDIAYFLGLFIAEGSVYKKYSNDKFIGGSVTITCGDPSVLNNISKLGLHVYVDKAKLRHTIGSFHLIKFLEYLGFDLSLKAPQKIIPSRLLQMSKQNIVAMLQGMFDGDGCCCARDGRVCLMSSSKKLIEQTRTILQNFGIHSTTYTHTVQPTKLVKVTSVQHTLECGSSNAKKFIEQIGFKIKRKQDQGIVNHQNKNYRCSTKDVIPFSVAAVKKGIIKRGIKYKFTKEGTSIAFLHTPSRLHVSKEVMLRFKNLLKPDEISEEFRKFLEEHVDENITWDSITSITNSENEVYDVSLPDISNDFWCHSVIYNGYLGHQTPNGVGNKFYEIYSGAESGKLKTWKTERINWWDVPGRDEEWKQTQIELLGSEEKFLEEFNNTFLDDSTSAVGALLIERFKQTKKPAIWTSEEGDYSVFEYPDKKRLYVIGVDVGEGIGRAASVAQVLDVTDLQDIKQVAVYGSAVIEPYHFANKLLTIGQSWGVPPILIERNNCGAQVIDALHYHHNYEKIVAYSKISTSDKYNSTRNLGVLSHTNIRSDGIGNMRYWVNHLQCVQINDPQTISEFETFVKHPNGVYKKRTDKFFDDRIMSLVWALFILKTEIVEQYFQIVDFDLQNHPLKIVANGYWENFSENYDLKDLSKNPSVVPKPAPEDSLAYPALGITQKELDTLDKYDLDEESLLEMGYTYFNQDV